MPLSKTGRRYLPPYFEDDDSDYDMTIEDYKEEMEVGKFYKNFLNAMEPKPNRPVVKRNSLGVQTDPDTSNIPPSWLVTGQKYVEELYRDLGNMINTLFHTPNGYCTTGEVAANGIEPEKLKFFDYKNGYYHSKLLPGIKMPAKASVEKKVQTDQFKKELSGLLEKATLLRNMMPHVIEFAQGTCSLDSELEKPCEKPSPSGTEAEVTTVEKAVGPDEPFNSSLDSGNCTDTEESEIGSVKSALSPLGYCKCRENTIRKTPSLEAPIQIYNKGNVQSSSRGYGETVAKSSTKPAATNGKSFPTDTAGINDNGVTVESKIATTSKSSASVGKGNTFNAIARNIAYVARIANKKQDSQVTHSRVGKGPNINTAMPIVAKSLTRNVPQQSSSRNNKVTVSTSATTKKTTLSNGNLPPIKLTGSNDNGVTVIQGKIASISGSSATIGKENTSNALGGKIVKTSKPCATVNKGNAFNAAAGKMNNPSKSSAAVGKGNSIKAVAGCSGYVAGRAGNKKDFQATHSIVKDPNANKAQMKNA